MDAYQSCYGQSTTTSPPKLCRLRHGLNSDCLIKIFECLSVQDLMQLCKVDNYFADLITTEIIAKKLINVGVLDVRMPNNRLAYNRSTIESFQMFGKFFKKIAVQGQDFNNLLHIIVEFCLPARLTEVELEFKLNSTSAVEGLIDQALPFFATLQTLRLFDVSSDGIFDHFLTKISKCTTTPQVLQLRRVDIAEDQVWLQNMQNLRVLQIHTPRIISLDNLISCFRVNPALKAFEYTGSADIFESFDVLSKCCPGLTTFSDCHLNNHYNDLDTDEKLSADMASRYKFLSTLTQLDAVTLTSYTDSGHDLYHHFKHLSLANISKFKSYMSWNRPILLGEITKTEIMRSSSMPFANLKTIEIEIRSIGNVHCDQRCQFIFDFMSRLKNIENITFLGRGLVNVNKVLQYAPDIRRLSIAGTDFQHVHLSSEIRNIVRIQRRIPIRHPLEGKCKKHLLQLTVNGHQSLELRAYEDIRRYMTTTIDKSRKSSY